MFYNSHNIAFSMLALLEPIIFLDRNHFFFRKKLHDLLMVSDYNHFYK